MNPKIKTRKAAKKRIKETKNHFFVRKKAYKAHLLRRKKSSQLRRLSSSVLVHKSDEKKFLIMIPYRN